MFGRFCSLGREKQSIRGQGVYELRFVHKNGYPALGAPDTHFVSDQNYPRPFLSHDMDVGGVDRRHKVQDGHRVLGIGVSIC
jgi:hypothetical protein